VPGSDRTQQFEAEHKDGSVIVKRDDGVLVLTSYVEPDEEVLADENYYRASGPRNAQGYIVDRESSDSDDDSSKTTKKAAAKKSAKK